MVEKPPKLGPAEAYEAIQALLAENDRIGRTTHVRDQMLRRNVTIDDVFLVLRNGSVSPDPEWSEMFQNWKYTIRGRDGEGDKLALIIALVPTQARITLITCF
jgi:hypothetical protein